MTTSPSPQTPSIKDELAAAMEWWREAGVDMDFTDDVTSWLHSGDPAVEGAGSEAAPAPSQSPLLESKPAQPAASQNDTPKLDFFASGKPETLGAFREFWMTAPELDAIGPRGRVPPRGEAGADLMVLVVDPEESDRETLLSGPLGRLLDRILSAANTQPEKVYVASALPRHTPMADTAGLAAGGLDGVLLHHIALAAPRRILAFGAQLSPFIAENPAGTQTSLRRLNYDRALPPTLLGEGLDALMETPPLKARFWRRWMEWSAEK